MSLLTDIQRAKAGRPAGSFWADDMAWTSKIDIDFIFIFYFPVNVAGNGPRSAETGRAGKMRDAS
jgi:hypothetical protein